LFLFLYTSRVKTLLRDKDNLFWTLMFPLLLATFFYIAFGSIMNKSENFKPVPTAVVNNEAYINNTYFADALKAASTGDNPILQLSVLNREQAEKQLESGEISGVITVSDTISLKVKQSGVNQSIIKAFLDQYLQTEKEVAAILKANPDAANQGLFNALGKHISYTKEISFSGADPNPMLNYFYALIAMACLYGSFWGMRNTTDMQANLSALGARRSVAPTHKMASVVSDGLAALTILFAEIMITVCYIAFVLGADFGTRWGYVVLTCFIGCVTGISFGTFVGSAIRKSEGVKTAILLGFSMVMSFLAGLMIGDMKIMIAQKAPILNLINPATLLTDAFYSLYIYESLDRFFLNIGILSIISLGLTAGSFVFIRRERYASI